MNSQGHCPVRVMIQNCVLITFSSRRSRGSPKRSVPLDTSRYTLLLSVIQYEPNPRPIASAEVTGSPIAQSLSVDVETAEAPATISTSVRLATKSARTESERPLLPLVTHTGYRGISWTCPRPLPRPGGAASLPFRRNQRTAPRRNNEELPGICQCPIPPVISDESRNQQRLLKCSL